MEVNTRRAEMGAEGGQVIVSEGWDGVGNAKQTLHSADGGLDGVEVGVDLIHGRGQSAQGEGEGRYVPTESWAAKKSEFTANTVERRTSHSL
jgi:hypothetical protein